MTPTDPPAIPPTAPPVPQKALPAPEPKKSGCGWITTIVLVVLVIGGLIGFRWWHGEDASAATQPTTQGARAVPVVVSKARKHDLPIYIDGLGTATALNTVTVRTRVDGQLIKVSYTEGQSVKEGDTLAEIDPRPFQVQLEQAQGQLAKDQALVANAQLDYKRYEVAKEAVSQQQLDTAKSLVTQYESSIAIDQATIDNAKLQLSYAHITAPLSGKIGLRLVDQGNMVHASDANGLAVITQLQPIAIVFSLPEDSLPQILKAYTADPSLPVEAYSRDMKTKITTGKVAAIDNQIDTTTGTAKLKASFENKDQSLFPNQFVNVRLLVDTLRNAIVVPGAAIQRSPQGTFAYVVKPDQTVEIRNITVGPSEGDRTTIKDGLAEGESVVTDGADKLRPGMAVTPREQQGQRAGKGTTKPATLPTVETRGSEK